MREIPEQPGTGSLGQQFWEQVLRFAMNEPNHRINLDCPLAALRGQPVMQYVRPLPDKQRRNLKYDNP